LPFPFVVSLFTCFAYLVFIYMFVYLFV
jgi:hypothetical protein